MLCLRGGVLFAISKTGVESFDVATAARAGFCGLSPHMTSRRDRFFSDGKSNWFVLAHDGQGPRLEKVPLEIPGGRVLTLFDRKATTARGR